MNLNRLSMVILIAILLSVLILLYKIESSPTMNVTPSISDDQSGKTYSIKRIQVLKGDYFDISMFEDKRILAKLSVLATEDSKNKVLDLMNHCTQPKVTLKSKDIEGRWIVEIDFLHENQKVNLAQWLTQNGLTYK
jgi:hypothetical protein